MQRGQTEHDAAARNMQGNFDSMSGFDGVVLPILNPVHLPGESVEGQARSFLPAEHQEWPR